MNNRNKRLVAMLLAWVLAIGALPVYAIDFELPEDSFEEVPDTVIYASYATIMDDDTISAGEGWLMSEPMGSNTIDVQWDNTNLYVAANKSSDGGSTVFSVTVKGVTKSDNLSSGVKELAVPFSEAGISVADYGTQIPATITLGNAVWEGVIVLSSTSWLHTNDSNPGTYTTGKTSTRGDDYTSNQGAAQVTGGFNIYDRFAEGENPRAVRITSLWKGLSEYNYCEFDMYIESLPVYKLGDSSALDYHYAVHGINWWMCRSDAYGVSVGIINTEHGLVLVLRGNGPDQTVRLNRVVGDTLHMGCRWEEDDSLTLFLDNVKIANFKNAKMRMGIAENQLRFTSLRSDAAAASDSDNIDITVTNIAIGNSCGESLLDALTFDDFKSDNTDQNAITNDLVLPVTLADDQLTAGKTVTWKSSDETVISATGVVNRPAKNSQKVILTAYCGVVSKKFTLMVAGMDPDGQVMYVENDLKTATGAGSVSADSPNFTLDVTNNSIIYNQGEGDHPPVNMIELIDSDEINRLNESVLTIWYSDDNETYTELDDSFKILRKGNKTYLYDFEIEAQYIKVHCTHYDKYEADFTNALRDMIRVYHDETAFATTSEVIIENDTGKAVYDQPYTVTLENAGVACLKTDFSDVRFMLDGKILYHYFDGENFVVRVPYIPVYGVAKLTVLSGNNEAMDISNKEYVHEVVYGTRESCDTTYQALTKVNKNEYAVEPQNELPHYLVSLPNNVMWGFRGFVKESVGLNCFYYKTSYDGGLTWSNNYEYESETTTVTAANNIIHDVRGAIYDDYSDDDENTGRLIVMGVANKVVAMNDVTQKWETTKIPQRLNFMYTEKLEPENASDWVPCPEIKYANDTPVFEDGTLSMDTYSKPVKLSTYSSDTTDTGVDFVLPVYIGKDENGNGMVSAVYSKDGGYTWILSDYKIYAEDGQDKHLNENGLTEANLLEDDNGRLVLLCRYQFGEIVNFATAYSYDGGISWTAETEEPSEYPSNKVLAKKSTVYSDNTQPLLYEYGGKDLLFWGGNNALGGISYMRFPLNVAVSYDNMKTFENIQNLFSRYSMQGMTMGDRMNVTNQSVDSSIDDTVTLIWYHEDNSEQTIVIDNFTDYFYRTKGAYDSFENTSTKYEGWSSVYGNASVSQACSTDGRYSMMIPGGVSVVRSIPYLQNGKIAFDLYLANVNNASAQFELESAYGTEYGKAAPIAFAIRNGKLYFLNADHSGEVQVAATLKTGWNHFEFDLELLAQTPSATLSVNSGEAVELPVDLAIGDYICYVDITTSHGMDYYLDSFLVQDMDVTRVPGETSGPKVYGNSILLGKNFAVKYFVRNDLFTSGEYSDPYMTFELNGRETTVKELNEEGDYYVFTFTNLAPNQLNERIYATLHATAADGSAYTSDTTFYSVAQYAYNQLANDDASDSLRTLLVDMLNYGTEAQLYKGETGNLANSMLTEEQKAWASADDVELGDDYKMTEGEVADPAVIMKSGALVLDDSVVIRVYFAASDITNLTIKVTGAGKEWTLDASRIQKKENDENYYVDFGHLNPAQMREAISFTAYIGENQVSETVQYSIESYAHSKIVKKPDETLIDLLKSMIRYGDAASAYEASRSAN